MKVRLGDVCKIVSGTTPRSTCLEYWDGDINWVTPAELSDDSNVIFESQRKITRQAVADSGLKPFPAGTVLLSSRAPIGKVAIAGIEMYCNQGFKNLVCSDAIYNRYLYHFLKGKTSFLNSLGRGATFKEISKNIVEEIQIPLPSLVEQRHIAAVLDKVSELISKRKAQLDKLDELVKSRFVEMFGDENSMQKWACCKISEISEVFVGVVIKPAQYYTTDKEQGVPAFRSLNIGEMYIKDEDWVYFTFEGNRKNSKSILQENDLAIVRSGAPGTACVITEKYSGFNAIDIIIARPDIEKINPIFMCAFTNLPHGKKQIEIGTGGAAQQHFNVSKYKEMDICLPQKELQDKFGNYVNQVDAEKQKIKRSLDQLETLKKALMQKYFG